MRCLLRVVCWLFIVSGLSFFFVYWLLCVLCVVGLFVVVFFAVLRVCCLMVGVRCSLFVARCSVCVVRCSLVVVWCSLFGVCCSLIAVIC